MRDFFFALFIKLLVTISQLKVFLIQYVYPTFFFKSFKLNLFSFNSMMFTVHLHFLAVLYHICSLFIVQQFMVISSFLAKLQKKVCVFFFTTASPPVEPTPFSLLFLLKNFCNKSHFSHPSPFTDKCLEIFYRHLSLIPVVPVIDYLLTLQFFITDPFDKNRFNFVFMFCSCSPSHACEKDFTLSL